MDAESDEVNRSEFKDVSEGALKQDTNGNKFVMVEDGISLDYNDDGEISDASVINDEMSSCDNVDNDGDGSDDKVISVERKDGKNTDNDDGEMSDDSVNSDEISDGVNLDNDFVEISDYSVNSDGEHVDNDDGGISDDSVNYYGTIEGENMDNDNVDANSDHDCANIDGISDGDTVDHGGGKSGTDDANYSVSDNNSVITISDEELNEDQTVAIPEIKRVVQRITLTMRRTFTYSHDVKSNVNTEYLWDVSQESTSV